jgi:hypothetical protein
LSRNSQGKGVRRGTKLGLKKGMKKIGKMCINRKEEKE